jgi:hypothetical protein
MTILATEDINRPLIRSILNDYLEGYTIIEAEGVWRKLPEKSILIYIAGVSYVNEIVEAIKTRNNQESVLVMTFPCSIEFK